MNISPRRRYRWLVLVPLLLALVGCAGVREGGLPPVQLWQIAREVPGADPRWQRADAATAGVRVWRGGREIAVQRLMELLPGDEIETGANAAAVLRFRDAGDTLVLERTRVRIGSLEVIFGRMFALLRNRFTVTSETVVAGVEGTRFLFEVGRDRAVRVAVADGAVVCRSPQDAWAPVRLQANEALLSRYLSRAPPMRRRPTRASCARTSSYRAMSAARPSRAGAAVTDKSVRHGPIAAQAASTPIVPMPCVNAGRCRHRSSGLVLQRWTSHAVDQSQCAGQFFDSEARAAGCYPRPPQPPAGTPRDPTKRY